MTHKWQFSEKLLYLCNIAAIGSAASVSTLKLTALITPEKEPEQPAPEHEGVAIVTTVGTVTFEYALPRSVFACVAATTRLSFVIALDAVFAVAAFAFGIFDVNLTLIARRLDTAEVTLQPVSQFLFT